MKVKVIVTQEHAITSLRETAEGKSGCYCCPIHQAMRPLHEAAGGHLKDLFVIREAKGHVLLWQGGRVFLPPKAQNLAREWDGAGILKAKFVMDDTVEFEIEAPQ